MESMFPRIHFGRRGSISIMYDHSSDLTAAFVPGSCPETCGKVKSVFSLRSIP
jgi:hypothetical protein